MANTVQIKRGSTASVAGYTGPVGELIYNSSTKRVHTQDGVTAGGSALALLSDVSGGGAVTSVNTQTGDVVLGKGDIGLGNVDNTSDANKPISTAQAAAINLKAPIANPAFTGTPTAPTAAQVSNNTQIATTAFVKAAVAALVDGAPEALDTLRELAEALGDDPNFVATITAEIGSKLSKAANLSDLADITTARANIGLGNVDNTSDLAKPISTATQTALNAKWGNSTANIDYGTI